MKSRSWLLFLLIAALVVVVAACSAKKSATPTAQPVAPTEAPAVAPTKAPTKAPTQAPPPTKAPTVAPKPTEIPFNATFAEEEGYWYSRYNLGNLVMRSGMGVTFAPGKEMVRAMIKMSDANPGDGDTAVPPLHPALLRAVYASGDPHYTQKLNVADFATQRWNPDTFDTTITTRAMGWTIIKESEWAKQFHVDSHFGTPKDDFGAKWRFVGMVLNAESKMQLQYALKNLKTKDGLFANSDGKLDYTGNWVMLEALSDVGNLLSLKHVPNSATNRYYNPEQGKMFLGAADMLFGALADRQPTSVEENSLAIQALTWYAASTTNADNRSAAVKRIAELGKTLANSRTTTATEHAFAIRGLIEAYRTTGDAAYLNAAAKHFGALSKDLNPDYGIFDSQHAYTIDDVATIMGALNSLKIFAGDAVDQARVEDMFTTFFLNAVNKSGLQQSVPPIPVAKDKFEQKEPSIFYGYPTIPKPPMAGGKYGIAPVFATEVSFDTATGKWKVTNRNFDAAGAMHASNEFIWFHNDEVNGFPAVP